MKKWLLCFLLLDVSVSWAQDGRIEFGDDELPTESVLPVFDQTSVVKNRQISVARRFEIGGGLGLNLGEALYQNMTANLTATYHLDEFNGINVQGIFTAGNSLSPAGEDLKAGKGLIGRKFDASKAPVAENLILGNYQYNLYYGKMSLTKQNVSALMLYSLAGAGVVSFGDSTSPLLNVGLGQKFYFTKDLALRFDLQLSIYQGPDPTKPKTANNLLDENSPDNLGTDDFESTIYFRSFLSGGIVFLF